MYSSEQLLIRPAVKEDTDKMLEIYTPYIFKTPITFEYDVPSSKIFQQRIMKIEEKYPVLVILRDNCLLGYAYISEFRSRAAYTWVAETSIYLSEDARGLGLGHPLYDRLESIAQAMGIRQLYAVITVPNPESEEFHKSCGYQLCGILPDCGFKDGQWHGVGYYRKVIHELSVHPQPLRPWRTCL